MKIYCDSSTQECCIIAEGFTWSVHYERKVTTNVGEYLAILVALGLALSLGATEVEILSDSMLAVAQINGVWKCRQEHLKPLQAKALELISKFAHCEVRWLPREQNPAGIALDKKPKAKKKEAQHGISS